MNWVKRTVLLIALALITPAALADSRSDWSESDAGRVRLIAAVTATGSDTSVPLGLEFSLKPGWKIYWRSPGDAGLPPEIDWAGSVNLAGASLSWPAPQWFDAFGLDTAGYEDDVILPVTARLLEPGAGLLLHASVRYLACSTVCIPVVADLALDLPSGPAGASSFAHAIDRFQARVPGDGAVQGLRLEAIEMNGAGVLEAVIAADPPLARPDLFVEGPEGVSFGRSEPVLEDGGRRVRFRFTAKAEDGPADLTGERLTVTLAEDGRTLEATSTAVSIPAKTGGRTLLVMLGIAFLGGLILNVMPCVLPVLSLKLLSLVSVSGMERWRVRGGFLASAAGIVSSFLVLALGLAGLKAAGARIGWGIQFQQPLFLTAMILVMTLFAANLWGAFAIASPTLSSRGAAHRGWGGDFAAGVLATLLATPCSAPFVGTALGFALARGPADILLIFAAMGIGMAAPYLILALAPGLAGFLPRPGRWMERLRFLFGFLMLGTGGWLLWVLAGAAGAPLALFVGVLAAALLAGLLARTKLTVRLRALLTVLFAGAALLAVGIGSLPAAETAASGKQDALWRPFDPDAIPALVADGHVVVVDITADWCLTCRFNKSAVLDREPVMGMLAASGVVAMRGDWTRPDDAIAAFLARFGRYGLPFNAVFGQGASDGALLPELLTADAVRAAFAQAKGGTP